MSNIAFSRIQRECKEVVSNKEMEETGIMIEIMNDQLTKIKGTINGPPDSPYEGGKFVLDLAIPDSYPFIPPNVGSFSFISFHIVTNSFVKHPRFFEFLQVFPS